ncbi:pyridoxamine 5'-phosphate oxidase family protein [Streptomyces sp. NBC_00029]|uniref:pyridoxamine 5'-phosphate oxidase family protein n=1 Tax=Streptomyces sp. NBC_00029 TaxID=2903613 RepID=UPI0032502F46
MNVSGAPAPVSVRAELTEQWGDPLQRVSGKLSPVLHDWLRRFIELSPFVVLASTDGRGCCDASPRGGAPGFVRVLDEQTLFVPEESGNRLLQTLRNLEENPGIGMLFLIPGMPESARVNGLAEPLTRSDPRWGELPLDEGERERLLWGSLVRVTEAYYHCGRSSRFGGLWDTGAIERHRANPPLAKRPAAAPARTHKRPSEATAAEGPLSS